MRRRRRGRHDAGANVSQRLALRSIFDDKSNGRPRSEFRAGSYTSAHSHYASLVVQTLTREGITGGSLLDFINNDLFPKPQEPRYLGSMLLKRVVGASSRDAYN